MSRAKPHHRRLVDGLLPQVLEHERHLVPVLVLVVRARVRAGELDVDKELHHRRREAALRERKSYGPRLKTASASLNGLVRLHFHARGAISNLFVEPLLGVRPLVEWEASRDGEVDRLAHGCVRVTRPRARANARPRQLS